MYKYDPDPCSNDYRLLDYFIFKNTIIIYHILFLSLPWWQLPEGFFDGHQTETRTKKTRVPSSKSGRSSKQQYIIKEEANDNDNDDDGEMMNSRHRMRLKIVAVALVFTVAALIAFGVALYFSSMGKNTYQIISYYLSVNS